MNGSSLVVAGMLFAMSAAGGAPRHALDATMRFGSWRRRSRTFHTLHSNPLELWLASDRDGDRQPGGRPAEASRGARRARRPDRPLVDQVRTPRSRYPHPAKEDSGAFHM
jgi:hypothetical protein